MKRPGFEGEKKSPSNLSFHDGVQPYVTREGGGGEEGGGRGIVVLVLSPPPILFP